MPSKWWWLDSGQEFVHLLKGYNHFVRHHNRHHRKTLLMFLYSFCVLEGQSFLILAIVLNIRYLCQWDKMLLSKHAYGNFTCICIDGIRARAEKYRTEFWQQVSLIRLLYKLTNVEQLYSLLSTAPVTFQEQQFHGHEVFQHFLMKFQSVSSIGLQKEILILLITVGVLVLAAVICLYLSSRLCPGCVPVCCVLCLGLLSRLLDRVLSSLFELCQ